MASWKDYQDGAAAYICSRVEVLSRENQVELARVYKNSESVSERDRAYKKLWESNAKLAVKIACEVARKYSHEQDDVISEALLGLARGIEKYEPESGYAVSTYVINWARAYAMRYVIKDHTIHTLTTQGARFAHYHLNEARQNLEERCGIISNDSLADELNAIIEARKDDGNSSKIKVSPSDIARAEALRKVVSLYQIVGESKSKKILDYLPVEEPFVDEIVANRLWLEALSTDVNSALISLRRELDEREIFILDNRVAADLAENECLKLKAIGNHFGISKERARQLEKRLKEKIEEEFTIRGLQFYFE